MNLCVNTGYAGSTCNPRTRMKNIARAGFTHLLWTQQWNTDYIYSDSEIRQIKCWLDEDGLKLQDIHGPVGPEKNWYSKNEYQRQAGVELVANRMKMLRALDGTGCVMMHVPFIGVDTPPVHYHIFREQTENLKKSLQELEPLSRELKVPISIENAYDDTFEIIEEILEAFPADFVGLCYDSGHGHMYHSQGLAHLEDNKHRLMAVHLHDNNIEYDAHQPPFYGNLDWEKLASIIKTSSFDNVPTFEILVNNVPFQENNEAFMDDAFERCSRVAKMLE